jgi:hypothetical protein
MHRIYAGAFAALGWFAVIGQYFNAYAGTPNAWNYLSFFTILSNILVAVTLTSAALAPDSSAGRFFARPVVATSVAVYITVTGLVYYFLLASLYDLEGWTKHFDHILHYVMPPAFVLYWLVFVRKGTLHVGSIPWMLIFPLLYGVYTLLRGPFVHWYPYPFIDVSTLGYPRTFRNIGEFIVFFAFMSSIYVLIDHLIGRIKERLPASPATGP